MNTTRKKIVIIGGGPGGYAAAILGARLNADVTLIENKKLGGTCLNAGCIPTKALKQCADVLTTIKSSNMYGVSSDNIKFDFNKAASFKGKVVNQLVSGVNHLVKFNKINLINGLGKIIDDKTVEVFNKNTLQTINTDYIIIATGTNEIEIPGFKTNGENVLNSTQMLSLSKLPKSLLIIGGGVIGVEFASIFNKFGVDVKVVELTDRIIPLEDKEISINLKNHLERSGVKIYTESKARNYKEADGDLLVYLEKKDNSVEEISCEKILVCVGRKTCLDEINIENLGIATEKKRIITDKTMKTNIDNIYAIGDVTLSDQLAHVAYAEARIAIMNIMGQKSEINYTAIPHCIYSSPEIASVGLSEDNACLKYENIKVTKFPFVGNGKALIGGDYTGFIKVVSCNSTGKILGFSIIGTKATELIAEPTLAITKNMTINDIINTIHAHPTLSEVIGEVCLSAKGLNLHSM